jgi:hypothetical protein
MTFIFIMKNLVIKKITLVRTFNKMHIKYLITMVNEKQHVIELIRKKIYIELLKLHILMFFMFE